MVPTGGRDFAVTPPPAHAGIVLAALLILPALVILLAFTFGGDSSRAATWNPGIGLAIIAAVGVMTLVGLVRRRVTLQGDRLHVRAGLFSQAVGADEVDLQRARVVDLAEHTELRPVIRTWGMSLPGYHAGHFRLRNQLGRAFCLVTDRQRVLWLPRRAGDGQLLLSVEQPQALLEALKAAQA